MGLKAFIKSLMSCAERQAQAGWQFTKASAAFAQGLSQRQYARSVFTTAYPGMGDLADVLLNFEEMLTQLQSTFEILMVSLDVAFNQVCGGGGGGGDGGGGAVGM